MESSKGITVKIDSTLHGQAKAEQQQMRMNMNQYITMILEEHFNRKGGIGMMGTKTMAFQIDESLFARLKAHLARTGLTQKAFVVGLVEQALNQAEVSLYEKTQKYIQAEKANVAERQELLEAEETDNMLKSKDGDEDITGQYGEPMDDYAC